MESNKNKNNLVKYVIVAILAVLIVGAGIALTSNKEDKSAGNGNVNIPSSSGGNENEIVPNKTKTEEEKNIIDFTNSKEVQINIADLAFKDQNIKIKKGTKVVWTNNDQSAHTVNSSGPGGSLNSGLFSNGETFELVFNDAGAFDYHCEVHPFMEGSITVVE